MRENGKNDNDIKEYFVLCESGAEWGKKDIKYPQEIIYSKFLKCPVGIKKT